MNNIEQLLSNISRNIVQHYKDMKRAQGHLGYVLTSEDIKAAVQEAAGMSTIKDKVTKDMILAIESELRTSFTFDGGIGISWLRMRTTSHGLPNHAKLRLSLSIGIDIHNIF